MRPMKRQLSEKDIVVGPNGEIKRKKRLRRNRSNVVNYGIGQTASKTATVTPAKSTDTKLGEQLTDLFHLYFSNLFVLSRLFFECPRASLKAAAGKTAGKRATASSSAHKATNPKTQPSENRTGHRHGGPEDIG